MSTTNIAALRALLNDLQDDDLQSVHCCSFQTKDFNGEAQGYVCGFDDESLDYSNDECHHTLPKRVAVAAVAFRKAMPALLDELECLRAATTEFAQCDRCEELRHTSELYHYKPTGERLCGICAPY